MNQYSLKGKFVLGGAAVLAALGGKFTLIENTNVAKFSPVKEVSAETLTFGDATLVSQERYENQMTMEEFAQGVNASVNYLRQYINYDHLQQHMQCLYYLINIEYIPIEVKQQLIQTNIVYDFNMSTGEGIELLQNAYDLSNVIHDYNQSMIREEKNTTPESIINVSHFCYDEHDAKLINNMHENYFYSYKNRLYPNEQFTKLFKQLTTLNAAEQEGNAFELSVGANWLAENQIGGEAMQTLRDDMKNDFPKQQLLKYFDEDQFNKDQWILREHFDDADEDPNCMSELRAEVADFAEMFVFSIEHVNDNLFKELEGVNDCMCNPSNCK